IAVMFKILRRQNVPKLSARLLRNIISFFRFLGFLFFRYGTDKDGLIILEDNRKWWRCVTLLHRIICVCFVGYVYSDWIIGFNGIIQKALKNTRTVLVITWIIRQQFFMNTEVISLANKSLKLFRRVRSLGNHKRVGFGGEREFMLIILLLCCRTYDFASILAFYLQQEEFMVVYYLCTTYIVAGINVMVYIQILAYFSIGFLYSELNNYIRDSLEYHFRELELKYDPIKLKKLKSKLKKCLNLHRDIFAVHTFFQRLFEFVIFLGFIQKVCIVGVTSYILFIDLKEKGSWYHLFIGNQVLDIFLLTVSVEEAKTQFSMIRWIHLESYNTAGNLKDLHNLLDRFYTQLNLYEFRVRICGVLDVSKKLFLLYMSALISWLVYLAQSNLLTNNN
ncbi:hypothetical protein KR074_003893, partial [Drosophila pseudoananassae]